MFLFDNNKNNVTGVTIFINPWVGGVGARWTDQLTDRDQDKVQIRRSFVNLWRSHSPCYDCPERGWEILKYKIVPPL